MTRVLKQTIQFQKKTEQPTSNGFDEENWEDLYKCRASYKPANGKEYFAAKAQQTEKVVTFTVRNCPIIEQIAEDTKRHRIIYKGNIHDIEYSYDLNNEKIYKDIKATYRG